MNTPRARWWIPALIALAAPSLAQNSIGSSASVTLGSGPHKGKKQFGIYKRDGDRWTVCMTAPGAEEKDRPKSFDTKGTPNVVFVFERVKEEKKD